MKSHLVLVVILFGCSESATPLVTADAGADGGSDATPREAIVDTSKLADDTCSDVIDCKTPNTLCANFRRLSSDPELQRPRCAAYPPCSIVTCPEGLICGSTDVAAGDVTCER